MGWSRVAIGLVDVVTKTSFVLGRKCPYLNFKSLLYFSSQSSTRIMTIFSLHGSCCACFSSMECIMKGWGWTCFKPCTVLLHHRNRFACCFVNNENNNASPGVLLESARSRLPFLYPVIILFMFKTTMTTHRIDNDDPLI